MKRTWIGTSPRALRDDPHRRFLRGRLVRSPCPCLSTSPSSSSSPSPHPLQARHAPILIPAPHSSSSSFSYSLPLFLFTSVPYIPPSGQGRSRGVGNGDAHVFPRARLILKKTTRFLYVAGLSSDYQPGGTLIPRSRAPPPAGTPGGGGDRGRLQNEGDGKGTGRHGKGTVADPKHGEKRPKGRRLRSRLEDGRRPRGRRRLLLNRPPRGDEIPRGILVW